MSLLMKNRLFNLSDMRRPGKSPQNRVHIERMAGARCEMKNAADGESADLYIYGDIAWYDITAQTVANALAASNAKTIRVHINSGGGDVFDGLAIYNLLAQKDATIEVSVDGLAASIASVIAMAGDKIEIAKNASMMIHNAWGIVMGDKTDMRAMADLLEMTDGQIADTYSDLLNGKTSRDDIVSLMNSETWMNAATCVEKGFADSVIETNGAKALVRPGLYANMPKELLADPENVPAIDEAEAKAKAEMQAARITNIRNRQRLLEVSL